MRRYTEAQIREGLDGKYVVHHFSGRISQITVPPDFDPFSPAGERLVQKRNYEKVPGA